MLSSRMSWMVRSFHRNGVNCTSHGFLQGLPELKLKCDTTRLCRVGYVALSTYDPPDFRYVNNCLYGKKAPPRSPGGVMAVIVALVAGACGAAGFGRRDVVECENNVEQLHEVGKPSQKGSHMQKYDHVVIGSGTAASAAIEGILLVQPDAKILLIAQESPKASLDTDTVVDFDSTKEVEDKIENELAIGPDLLESFIQWRRHITEWLPDDCEAMGGSVDVIRNPSVKIDIEEKIILLGDGVYSIDHSKSHLRRVKYEKCILAPTGQPRKLYVLDGDRAREELNHSINTLQSLEDFQTLEAIFNDEERNVKHISVIGGGFLGAEVAGALAKRGQSKGVKVSHVYAEQYPMQRVLPPYLVKIIEKKFKNIGITPVSEHLVTDVHYDMDSGRLELIIKGWEDQSFETDYVVLASTHIVPDVSIARDSGIEIDKFTGGVVVNSQLEAIDGLYAAGGSTSFFDRSLGRRRIDRYDHAINSGLTAGQNMASSLLACRTNNNCNETDASDGGGSQMKSDYFTPPGPRQQLYMHQPVLRSNQSAMDVVLEGIGDIDARLQTVGLWVNKYKSPHKGSNGERPYHRGVIYYLRGDKIVGILLWNATDLLERARDVIIRQPTIMSAKKLICQIPIAPDDWLRIEESPAHVSLTERNNEILTPPF